VKGEDGWRGLFNSFARSCKSGRIRSPKGSFRYLNTPSRLKQRPRLTADATEEAERRERIAEQERYLNGADDTPYKFELLLSPRAARGQP
jgi:hypothetical protein